MEASHPPLKILLIDDNQDHAKILKWAFERSGQSSQLVFLDDGQSALEYLGIGNERKNDVPDLILLDFNLPKVDGREILRILKSDTITKQVPVIVLSSSEREEDIRKAYELGASTYVSKSDVLGEFDHVLRTIQDYWSRIAKLPTRK